LAIHPEGSDAVLFAVMTRRRTVEDVIGGDMDQRHTNIPACCGHVASAIPIDRQDHIGLRFRFINRCIGSSVDENVRAC
jgi:hypothetical protein